MEKWQDPNVIIFWIIFTIILLVILLIFITSLIKIHFKNIIKKREQLFKERLENEKKIKNAMILAQDTERKLIASEIHDQISNKLNLLILKLTALEPNEAITNVKSELKSLVQKNRDISHLLFPIEIENLGLIFTLQDLSMKNSSSEFKINLHIKNEFTFESKQIEHQLYRVIQEAMNNAIKHGKAKELNIFIDKIKDKICLLITDNGLGFKVNEAINGIGLTNIDTRLKTINATYKIKSAPNKGTRLIITL